MLADHFGHDEHQREIFELLDPRAKDQRFCRRCTGFANYRARFAIDLQRYGWHNSRATFNAATPISFERPRDSGQLVPCLSTPAGPLYVRKGVAVPEIDDQATPRRRHRLSVILDQHGAAALVGLTQTDKALALLCAEGDKRSSVSHASAVPAWSSDACLRNKRVWPSREIRMQPPQTALQGDLRSTPEPRAHSCRPIRTLKHWRSASLPVSEAHYLRTCL